MRQTDTIPLRKSAIWLPGCKYFLLEKQIQIHEVVSSTMYFKVKHHSIYPPCLATRAVINFESIKGFENKNKQPMLPLV